MLAFIIVTLPRATAVNTSSTSFNASHECFVFSRRWPLPFQFKSSAQYLVNSLLQEAADCADAVPWHALSIACEHRLKFKQASRRAEVFGRTAEAGATASPALWALWGIRHLWLELGCLVCKRPKESCYETLPHLPRALVSKYLNHCYQVI